MWRDEQHPGAGGGKPAGEQLCGALGGEGLAEQHLEPAPDVAQLGGTAAEQRDDGTASLRRAQEVRDGVNPLRDRKSTRLNSSHRTISYAVFCLKKKKKNRIHTTIQDYITHTRHHPLTKYSYTT